MFLVRVTAFVFVEVFLLLMAWAGFSLIATPPVDADFNVEQVEDGNA